MSGRRAAGRSPKAPVDGAGDDTGTSTGAGLLEPEGSRSTVRLVQRRRRRRVLKIVGLSTAGVVAVAAGGATYLYFQLSGNIHHDALYTGSNQAAAVGVEKADPFGRKPLNLLLIGSDTRDTAADCRDGGACGNGGAGANADVEMVVHLSADRSNITVMSIPRDTYAHLADCVDPTTKATESGQSGKINSSLQYGPTCTAMTVHKLTGITIDEYAMVDFNGVEQISDALGGVDLCFNHSFYDINSGLKLKQGTHMLKGKAALEFLRTRDSFGDGSDNAGRTTATHVFFTQMINTLKSNGTLSNVGDMYSIAQAATKALTVSDNIGTIPKLLGLVQDLNKVSTNRITFTTMQNVQPTDPVLLHNGDVVEGPDAPVLFNAIINDQSLTASSGATTGAGHAVAATATPGTSSAPAVPPADINVAVENGSGANGQAGVVATGLRSDGFGSGTSAGDAPAHVPTSSLVYGSGDAGEAQTVAKALGLPAKDVRAGSGSGLVLTLGTDWTSGTSFPGGKTSAAPVDTSAALNGTNVQVANQDKCVDVSTQYTENKLGLPGDRPGTVRARRPRTCTRSTPTCPTPRPDRPARGSAAVGPTRPPPTDRSQGTA